VCVRAQRGQQLSLTIFPRHSNSSPTLPSYTGHCAAYYSVRSAASRAQNKGWRVDYALGANLQGAEVVQHSTWPKNDHVPFYVTLKQ